MKKTCIFFVTLTICILLNTKTAHSDEEVDLSTPVAVNPALISVLKIQSLVLDVANSRILITMSDGINVKQYGYTGAKAQTLLHQLNNANFSVNSLEKNIFNQLISDGFIAGSISGAPL